MIRTLVAYTILIPILYTGPGELGSRWQTEVIVVNPADRALDGHGIVFRVLCPIPEGCPAPALAPRELGFIDAPQSTRGLLWHVPDEHGPSIEIQAEFGERSSSRFLQQLPIAREEDFRTTGIALPIVRTGGNVRTALRIYSPDPLTDQQVRVTVRPWHDPAGTPIVERIVTLEAPKLPTQFPLIPSFAELLLQRDLGLTMQVRVEVEPLPRLDGRIPRIWAFATVTDNLTHDVAVVSPQ